MKNFADRLIERSRRLDSVVCVGLDPQLERLPKELLAPALEQSGDKLEGAAEAVAQFCREVIGVVADTAVAVKPQAAFFEKLGWPGMRALAEVCRRAHEAGLLVIADVKRGDIGSTAAAYAQAYLGRQELGTEVVRAWTADAVTVNPYLGQDGVEPFVREAARFGGGVFVLVRTSNPSAGQLQDLSTAGKKVYEHVAELLAEQAHVLAGEAGYSALGAVVGATYPEELADLRKRMPRNLFLVPGYGAQGGTAEDVAAAFDLDGNGAVVNASRSVIFAFEKTRETPWKDAVRQAAADMREELNRVRRRRK